MSDIVITGIGQVPVGEHWEVSLRQLAARAILAAIHDAGGQKPQALYVGNVLGSSLSRQANLGALLTGDCGMEGVEGTTIEAAGASGGAALHTAYLALRSGQVDCAMVVGIEKITDMVGSGVDTAIAETITRWQPRTTRSAIPMPCIVKPCLKMPMKEQSRSATH
jgi:acetyl-CoA C-acetyltransferase